MQAVRGWLGLSLPTTIYKAAAGCMKPNLIAFENLLQTSFLLSQHYHAHVQLHLMGQSLYYVQLCMHTYGDEDSNRGGTQYQELQDGLKNISAILSGAIETNTFKAAGTPNYTTRVLLVHSNHQLYEFHATRFCSTALSHSLNGQGCNIGSRFLARSNYTHSHA